MTRRALEEVLHEERGQTFVEYVMILGLVSAIIIAVTGIIVPGFANAVVGLVNHMVVYLSSS